MEPNIDGQQKEKKTFLCYMLAIVCGLSLIVVSFEPILGIDLIARNCRFKLSNKNQKSFWNQLCIFFVWDFSCIPVNNYL